MLFLLEKSEPSLFHLEKFKSSSDHPSIKVIHEVLLLTHISYFLQTLQDIYFRIDHHYGTRSELSEFFDVPAG